MIDFYLRTCLSFLIKLDMASQTLRLPEMNLSQFFTQSIFGNDGTYIYCVLKWNWRPYTMVGACVKKIFLSVWSNYIIWKMNFSAGLSLFANLVLKSLGTVFGCHTDLSIRIHNTVSLSNLATMILVQWHSQII